MKKFSTFLTAMLLIMGGVLQAQQLAPKQSVEKNGLHSGKAYDPSFVRNLKQVNESNRNATYSVMLDNPSIDAYYANFLSTDFYYDPTLEINANYPNTTSLTHRYAVGLFDSLLYIDNVNQVPAFFPRRLTTLTLDSLDVYFTHTRNANSTSNDSIRITVFDRDSLRITGSGPAEALVNNIVWDTLIVTNQQIPLNVSNGGTPTFTVATFYPKKTFALGKTFGVRVDFAGDTANKFTLISSFRDDCGNACVASPSAANSPTYTNSLYYINAVAGGTQNISGINSVSFTCGPPCNEWTAQNWWIYPWVTADVAYGATILADSLQGCANTQINLTAVAAGSTDAPFSYSWATTSGTLTSTSGEQTSLILGGSNATVSVTVTDANNQTTTSTIQVTSRAITVSFANPTVTINCGSSTNLIPTVGGNQNGKAYTWSTGAASASLTNVDMAGNYRVTVTNNTGCSATASVAVQYTGGVTNTVSFQLPAPSYCIGKELTFNNTSTNTTNWTYYWTFGDGQLGFNEDGVVTYNQAGFYTIKLVQDSAGCKFASATQNITVAQICTGIEDVTFANGVNLMPNPTNGNVTLKVEGVEGKLTMKVYNIIGSEVMNFSTTDATSNFNRTFDLSNLNNGTYLVKVQSGDKVAVKRLTVAK